MVCSCDSDCGEQFEMDIYDSENAMLPFFKIVMSLFFKP